MATHITRPGAHEYTAPNVTEYIAMVPDGGNVIEQLEANAARYEALMRAYPVASLAQPHASGEWTLLDVMQHVIDSERVFAYRALRFARGDTTVLPGYEQDDFAAGANANARALDAVLDEYRAVRAASIALARSFDDAALDRVGTASSSPISVRACVYVIVGHELYHLRSVLENYGEPRGAQAGV